MASALGKGAVATAASAAEAVASADEAAAEGVARLVTDSAGWAMADSGVGAAAAAAAGSASERAFAFVIQRILRLHRQTEITQCTKRHACALEAHTRSVTFLAMNRSLHICARILHAGGMFLSWQGRHLIDVEPVLISTCHGLWGKPPGLGRSASHMLSFSALKFLKLLR